MRFKDLFSKKNPRAEQKSAAVGKLESLGFELIDRRGWYQGVYASRRYFLKRGTEEFGPFDSLNSAIKAARDLSGGS